MGLLLASLEPPSIDSMTHLCEYMTPPVRLSERAGNFWVNLDDAHHQLAGGTLGLIRHKAGFNICDILTSHQRNSDILDLPRHVKERISPALAYACRSWAGHFQRCPLDSHFVNESQIFFKNDFLSWLSALSLLGGAVGPASQALSIVEGWQARTHEDVGFLKCHTQCPVDLMNY
ncbi:hypothetical protein BC834DRAFT_691890 [Gloeopeniophorella convolvens]|nr:hypothetical protein BC834DRAFT_691890 [Gloeopeniophorella convolvens]